MQPLRGLHHVAALVLEPLGGELADLRVELALLEFHRDCSCAMRRLLPVDLADQDDNDDEQDGGEEAGTVNSHWLPIVLQVARSDSTVSGGLILIE